VTILFYSGFEDGDLRGFYWSYNQPNVVMASSSVPDGPGPPHPIRSGDYSMRCYLHHYESTYPQRVDLHVNDDDQLPPDDESILRYAIGGEYWFGLSIYIPSSFVSEPHQEVLWQIHGDPDPGEDWRNAPISLRIDEEEWVLKIYADSKAMTPPDGTPGRYTRTMSHFEPFVDEIGSWTDFVIHLKLYYDNAHGAFVDVWRNDVLIFEDEGANCFNDIKNPYSALGLYFSTWNSPDPTESDWRLYYIDEFRIGDASATYEDVVPAGGGGNGGGEGEIAFDAVSTNQGAGPEEISVEHTASGSDRMAVILVTGVDNDETAFTFDSVTYDGNACTFLAGVGGVPSSGRYMRSEIWYYANPPTGTKTVYASAAESSLLSISIAVITFAGVDGIGNFNATQGVSTTPSVSVTTGVNNALLVGGIAAFEQSGGLSPGANIAERYDFNAPGGYSNDDHRNAGGDKFVATPAAAAFNYTIPDSDDWTAVAIELRPAGASYYQGLSVQGIGELALCAVGDSPLRIHKGTTYGIALVATDDPNASAVRIQTPAGIKALREWVT